MVTDSINRLVKRQQVANKPGVVPRASSNTRVVSSPNPSMLLSFYSYITIACKYLDWPFLALYTYVMLFKTVTCPLPPTCGKNCFAYIFSPVTHILNFFGIVAERQFSLIWLCNGVLPRLSFPLPLSKGMSWKTCYTLLSWQERRRVRKEAGMFFAQACGAPIESWNSMEEWPGGIHYKDISKTLQSCLRVALRLLRGQRNLL